MTKYGYAGVLSAGPRAAAPGIRLSGFARPAKAPRRQAGALLAAALAAWRRRRAVARTIAELSALDDHMLYDIGIERSRIPAVAHALVDGGQASGRR